MSLVLGTFAPLVLLSMLAKRELIVRIAPLIRLTRAVGARLGAHHDSWRREITVYEVLTGEIPRRSRR